MAEIKENSRETYSVYNYVFSLEEQLKSLKTEKQMNFARITQLQVEIEKIRKELNEFKAPPLIVGTIQEVLSNGKALVKNSNNMEFLVKSIPDVIAELEVGKRVGMNQRSLAIVRVFPVPVAISKSIRLLQAINALSTFRRHRS